MTASYQWDFLGRTKKWTGKIFKTGFSGSTTTVLAGAEMRITWGDQTNSFDDRVRAMEVVFSIVDPLLTVYNDLSSGDEGDFTVEFTESGSEFTFTANIRLDEVSTAFAPNLRQNITTIYGYCGLAETQNIDAVTLASSTIHNLYRLILASSAIAQDIEYYSTHHPENTSTTGALLDLIRLNRLDLIFPEEGRKVDTMYDQLQSMLEWGGLFVMNGMDDRWHVKHEYGLGEVVTDRGGQFFDYSLSSFTTLATLTGKTITLLEGNYSADMVKSPIKPIQAVQIKRGNARDFFSVDMVKHGDYENGWTSASNHEVWSTEEGTYSRSTNSDTGTYAFRLDAGSSRADQRMLRFAGGGQEVDLEVAFRYALESDSASTTKSGSSSVVLFYKNPTTLDVERGGGGTTWSPTVLNAITLASGIVASGDPLVWTTLITTIYGPLPDFDGEMIASKQGSLTNFHTYFDTFEVRIKKGDAAKMDFRAVSGRYDLSGNLIGSGGVVDQEVPIYNALLGTDLTEDGTRDAVYPMIQVLTTPSGSWVQASDFKSLTIGYSVDDYPDSFELTSEIRIAQQNQTLEAIEGSYLGIAPHDYLLQYGARSYIQVYTSIDLRREVTDFVAHRKILSATDTAAPTTLYWGDANRRLRKAALLQPGEGVWTSQTVATLTRDIVKLAVDEQSGYWFVLENVAAGGQKLMRYDIDGTNSLELIDDTSTQLFDFRLGRIGKDIYVVWDDSSGSGTAAIRKYDYSGNLVSTIKSDTGIIKIQWVGVHPSETFVYYRRIDTAPPTADETKSINLSTLAETTLLSSTTMSQTGEINVAVVDGSENKLWVFGSKSGSDRAIIEISLPSGGSESDYRSTSDGLVDEGIAINRDLERIAYNKGNGDLYWNNYAGTDEQQIIEGGGAGVDVEAMDFGYN